MTKRALVVVDVQNDFISGSLSLSHCPSKHDGAQIVPIINKLVQETHFDLIAYTQDWQPSDHISFVDNTHLRTFHHSCNRAKEEIKVKVACLDITNVLCFVNFSLFCHSLTFVL